MLAATGPVQAVVPAATPSIVTALLLYRPCMYHMTWPTATLGAVNDHPLGAVGPVVGVVNVGVALDWLCTK